MFQDSMIAKEMTASRPMSTWPIFVSIIQTYTYYTYFDKLFSIKRIKTPQFSFPVLCHSKTVFYKCYGVGLASLCFMVIVHCLCFLSFQEPTGKT